MATDTRSQVQESLRARDAERLQRNKQVAREVIERIFMRQEDSAIDELVSDRFVARKFMGIEPTGNGYSIDEIHILRIEDGQLVEHWHEFDRMALLGQLRGDAPG